MKKLIFIFIFLSSFLLAKETTYGNVEISKVVSVIDGDTFIVDINNFPEILGKNIPIRIYGIDTPELKSKNLKIKKLAFQAKDFTNKKLSEASEIILKNIRRGKYFRIVAEVWIDGEEFSPMIIKQGLAKPYFGGKKPSWK